MSIRNRAPFPLRLSLTTCALLATLLAAPFAGAELTPDTIRRLESSPYVYVATQRKDGSFGTAAEIWFMYDQGAIWMASPITAWRVKRIRAGRPAARIAVGKKDGPSFMATGSFVRDPGAYERLYATFAKKYPDGWPKYAERFRDGLKDGSRVLMRYQPAPMPSPATASPRP